MGRPAKVVVDNSDLDAYEEAELTIAQILQERCGTKGCLPKWHVEEAQIILRKLIILNIIIEKSDELY